MLSRRLIEEIGFHLFWSPGIMKNILGSNYRIGKVTSQDLGLKKNEYLIFTHFPLYSPTSY